MTRASVTGTCSSSWRRTVAQGGRVFCQGPACPTSAPPPALPRCLSGPLQSARLATPVWVHNRQSEGFLFAQCTVLPGTNLEAWSASCKDEVCPSRVDPAGGRRGRLHALLPSDCGLPENPPPPPRARSLCADDRLESRYAAGSRSDSALRQCVLDVLRLNTAGCSPASVVLDLFALQTMISQHSNRLAPGQDCWTRGCPPGGVPQSRKAEIMPRPVCAVDCCLFEVLCLCCCNPVALGGWQG